MLFVGVDWAEAHHDVCVLDAEGQVLGRRRINDTLEGVRELHALIGNHVDEGDEPSSVVVGIEKDKGLIVKALVASGYEIYAINPMAAARYRDRHHVSKAKSDSGDAKMLADLVRTDRHNHRSIARDTPLGEALKVLARSHQNAVWERVRQVNVLRASLHDYYPGALVAFGTDLAHQDALGVLAVAPTPSIGRTLSKAKIVSALRKGGRQRRLEGRAEEIHAVLRDEQLAQPPVLEHAYGRTTAAAVAMLVATNAMIVDLEAALNEHFEQHPDAKIIRSLPGMGMVLGARVLGEFGDDPNRYADSKSRRNYAGTSPITRASGRSMVVLARHGRNRRLASALDQWAFSSLKQSPGARHYYDELRAREKSHRKALRQLANRWVSIFHTCVERGVLYDESLAWRELQEQVA
jgi:Transposase/Transposase IS116/IS110/IS902 family